MRIVVSGGRGRLGRRIVPWLVERGHDVYAPPRSEVDWTDVAAVRAAVAGADRVLALASWTDVSGAESQTDACRRDTVSTIEATIAALSGGTELLYVSSDYVLAMLRGQAGAGFYTRCKLVAEERVRAAGHRIARLAFVTPEQAAGWSWVDGLSIAHRCWVDELVPQLGAWVTAKDPSVLAHIGGAGPMTLADLLRRRLPDHPALARVITSADELRVLGRIPMDTCWTPS